MEFKVMNREDARRFSFKNHEFSSMMISISSVGSPENEFQYNLQNGIKFILKLCFNDVEKDEPNCMTESNADLITHFVEKYKNEVDCIIVHCDAGVSRSAGICAAIMKYLQGDDWAIFNNWKYCPNMTCYRMVLNSFSFYKDLNISEDKIKEKEKVNISEWCRENNI